MLRAITVGLAVIILLPLTDVASQPSGAGQMALYQENTMRVIRNARRLIEPVLTREEREIARSIDYRVIPTQGVNAFATREDGRRLIAFHAGIIMGMDWILQAYLLEHELGHTGCFKAYLDYYARGVVRNSEIRQAGGQLQPVGDPLFYSQHGGQHARCRNVKKQDIIGNPGLGPSYPEMMEASIMAIFLHELGHHVLGHVDKDPSSISKAMSREQEDEADQWAIETAMKKRYHLEVALPFHALMLATGGNSLESELKSTHPLGLRRYLKLYETVLADARRNPSQYGPSAGEVIAGLERVVKHARNTVEAIR